MKTLFIGMGHMGSALIKGINNNENYGYHYDETKLNKLVKELRIKPLFDLSKIKELEINTLVLGVRVVDLESTIKLIDTFDLGKVTIVSMASGVAIETIKSYFKNNKVDVVRIMPNVNAEYNLSTTAITPNASKEIISMFEKCGSVFTIEESNFSNFTIAAGCMPAYVVQIVNEWINNAVNNGMKFEEAKHIINDAFIGTLKSWDQNDKSADQIINEIATPGGVTAEGTKILKESNLNQIINEAYTAAINKDKNKK